MTTIRGLDAPARSSGRGGSSRGGFAVHDALMGARGRGSRGRRGWELRRRSSGLTGSRAAPAAEEAPDVPYVSAPGASVLTAIHVALTGNPGCPHPRRAVNPAAPHYRPARQSRTGDGPLMYCRRTGTGGTSPPSTRNAPCATAPSGVLCTSLRLGLGGDRAVVEIQWKAPLNARLIL